METVLEKSIEKEKREEEEKQNVLTERTKNEAQRAETHAKLRHEVRTDIAEDAKMSWYFEMLDDVGKKMDIVSDDSVTNSNSTTNRNITTRRKRMTKVTKTKVKVKEKVTSAGED